MNQLFKSTVFIQESLLTYLKSRFIPISITIIFTVLILVLLLNRFWQYEVFYYDHGYTEGAAYQVAHFRNPLWDRDGKVSIFTDHVYPSLLLLFAPFYWINDSYLTPIFVLSALYGLSVLIAYEIGHALRINKLMLYALLFAYMFFIGTQNAVIFFLKDISASIPFLMLLFLTIIKKKMKLFYILLLVNLGFKETIAITTASLGMALFLFGDKSWKKHAIAIILISVIYSLFISKIFVPYFRYQAYGQIGSYGFNPDLKLDPFFYLVNFFNTPQKRETIFASLSNFGFLPIFTPFGLLMTIQDFAQRFVLIHSYSPLRQGLNLHYNISLAAILFFGSVLAIKNLQKKQFYKRVLIFHVIFIILIVTIYHRFIYHGPFGLIYNKDFFNITRNMKFMDEFIEKIPREGKLMIQNNLAVRFTHDDLYILENCKKINKVQPDVIVFDFRPGQNVNNWWPTSDHEMKINVDLLSVSQSYSIKYTDDYRYIFTRTQHEFSPLPCLDEKN